MSKVCVEHSPTNFSFIKSSAYLGTWQITSKNSSSAVSLLSKTVLERLLEERKKKAIQQSDWCMHFCGAIGVDVGEKAKLTSKQDNQDKGNWSLSRGVGSSYLADLLITIKACISLLCFWGFCLYACF